MIERGVVFCIEFKIQSGCVYEEHIFLIIEHNNGQKGLGTKLQNTFLSSA